MTTEVFRGVMELAATETFAIVTINPAERDGYANRILRAAIKVYGDDTANNGKNLVAGASVKIPSRTNFLSATDGFEPDCLGLFVLPFTTAQVDLYGDPTKDQAFYVEEPVFQDTLDLFVQCPAAVASAKYINLHYHVESEPVKITDRIRDLLNRRCYS